MNSRRRQQLVQGNLLLTERDLADITHNFSTELVFLRRTAEQFFENSDLSIGLNALSHLSQLRPKVDQFRAIQTLDNVTIATYAGVSENLAALEGRINALIQHLRETLGPEAEGRLPAAQTLKDKHEKLLFEAVENAVEGQEPEPAPRKRGGQTVNIPEDTLASLVDSGLKITEIARAFKVHPNTISNRMKEYGIVSPGNRNVDDDELDVLISKIKDTEEGMYLGATLMQGK